MRVVGSQACAVGQSADVRQPHLPPFAVYAHTFVPAGLPLQSVHAPPLSPHCVFVCPPWQLPFAQQPPLHGCVGEHVDVHLWVVRSHARNVPQSAELLQPHAPLSVHALPSGDFEQSTHALDAPHAFGSLPARHTPVDEQQPVLHGSFAQLFPHLCVTLSQISPASQSYDEEQPHSPPLQMCPSFAARQSTHAAPAFPQAAADGFLHASPEQQPVLHEVALHVAPVPASSAGALASSP